MLRFKFNRESALAALLYVTRRLTEYQRNLPDIHKVFKVLYAAERKHLARYAQPIFGDFYIAMEYGPVPSHIYDWIKTVRGERLISEGTSEEKMLKEHFAIEGQYLIRALKEEDIDELSESAIECLNEALEELKDLHFGELKERFHDRAYDAAVPNGTIPIEEMIRAEGGDENTVRLAKFYAENDFLFSHL